MNSPPSDLQAGVPAPPMAVGDMAELRELLTQTREGLSLELPRSYVFVPFTEEEIDDAINPDLRETSLAELAERRASRVDVRQLAIGLRETRIENQGMDPAVTTCSQAELLEWFNGCDHATQQSLLEKAALKVPYVLTYDDQFQNNAETLEKRAPRAGDTVLLSAHGSSTLAEFSPGQTSSPDLNATPRQVIARMRQNDLIPGDIGKIRLACCGSRNELFNAFKQACEEEGAYVGVGLVGYGLDAADSALFSFGSEKSEDLDLILHDLDKGLRTVVGKGALGDSLRSVRADFYKISSQVHALKENISLMEPEDVLEKQDAEEKLGRKEAKKAVAFAAMQAAREGEQKSTRSKVRDAIAGARPAAQHPPASPGQAHSPLHH